MDHLRTVAVSIRNAPIYQCRLLDLMQLIRIFNTGVPFSRGAIP